VSLFEKIFKRLFAPVGNRQESASIYEPLLGQRLQSVEKQDYTWFFTFNDQIAVSTESPWRFMAKGRIVVTSEDDGHQFGLPAPVDAAQRVLSEIGVIPVTTSIVDASTGDLTIKFGNDVYIQFLQMSCGYESWRLGINGTDVFCTGGGQIAIFRRPSQ
jgi:hypothetical protein